MLSVNSAIMLFAHTLCQQNNNLKKSHCPGKSWRSKICRRCSIQWIVDISRMLSQLIHDAEEQKNRNRQLSTLNNRSPVLNTEKMSWCDDFPIIIISSTFTILLSSIHICANPILSSSVNSFWYILCITILWIFTHLLHF